MERKQQQNRITRERAEKLLQECHNILGSNVGVLLEVSFAFPELIDLNKTPVIPSTTIEGRLKEASLYENLNMPLEEEKIYQDILERIPNHWKTRLMYAYFLSNYDEYDEAIELLQPLINATPKPPDNTLMKTYQQLSVISFNKGDYENAKKYASRGLAIDPENAPLLSMRDKLTLPDFQKVKLKPIYEKARVADPSRFERNHPLPSPEKAKVSLDADENKAQNDKPLRSKTCPSIMTFAQSQQL